MATGRGAISKHIPWVCDLQSKADPTDRGPGLGLTAGDFLLFEWQVTMPKNLSLFGACLG